MTIHPARRVPFPELLAGLEGARAAGKVFAQDQGPLRLYHYTDACVYDGAWDEWALLARGLVLDLARSTVVATPFPKFFNYGEHGTEAPSGPFEAYEKLDGSLGIAFHYDDQWRVLTKGAFGTAQARWAEARLAQLDSAALTPGATYLFEIVHRANRIVVRYAFDDLVLLGAYDPDGRDLAHPELVEISERLGSRVAERHALRSIPEVLARAEALGRESEGFVLRFADGSRLKVKGSEYRRIHRLVLRITPLGIWEALAGGTSLADVRRDVPEEYWADFDAIVGALRDRISALVEGTEALAREWADRPDREVGVALQRGELPPPHGDFLFGLRKSRGPFPDPRTWAAMLRHVRPTGNALPGYAPSTGLARALSEEG